MMLPPLRTLSIGAAALLSVAQLLPLASAGYCRWNYSSNCSPSSKQVTYAIEFEVDTGDSNLDNDGYSAAVTFYWGDGSENSKVTDTFSTGESHTISESHNYDNDGSYLAGVSLLFVDGARGCTGETFMETLEMGNSCGFSPSSAPPPAPGPTPDETPEPTPEPSEKLETESPTVKPTFAPSVQPTNPPTTNEPVATTTVATTTIAVTTTESVPTDPSSSASTTTTATVPATDSSTTESAAVSSTTTTPAATTTTTTESSSQRQLVPVNMTLYNVGELNDVALGKWKTKTEQQITTHSGNEDITVTINVINQVPSGRRFLRQQDEQLQHSRSLADGGYLDIHFNVDIETKSSDGLAKEDDNAIVTSGFSTSARQTEYIYSLKSADSATFGDIERMLVVVDGKTVVPPGINSVQKLNGGGGDEGVSSMGIIIGAAAGGALVLLFIVIGSIFYTKRQRLGPRSGSLSKDAKRMTGDDIMGKEWSTGQRGPGTDELTVASPYLGTIESKEGEDDVSTLGDPYFGEAIDARDTGTVAESMVSSDMLALGVKRRAIGSSNASRMDATTATGFTSGLGSTYPMTFADDTTLDDAYQTPDAIGFEEEEDEDYERLVVVAPPGKLGIVIDNPSGNIPFVHAIKETSVLKGKVQVGDLLLSVDEVDCRGMHSMAVSKLISNRGDNARTLKLLRNTSC